VTTSQNAIKPPVAKRVDSIRTVHGDEYNDVYAWLAHKDDPDTIALLEAENAYTEQETAHLKQLREDLFNEVKSRTQETDLSLPVRKGGFWYYTRTVEGQQYGIHCRVAAGESTEPPATESGKPLDGEEILLDGNELAAGHDFFTLGTFDISPDGNWLAYSTDFSGDERYTIRIKDLRTGEVLADEIGNVGAGSVWSLDASVLFYTRVDDAWRPFQVWRHILGAPVDDDQIVYHEEDEQFFMEIDLSRSERFIFITCGSSITTEVRFIPADAPLTAPVVIAPRRHGVEYYVEHHGHRFLITHNDGAEDYMVSYTSVDDPGEWVELVPHSPGTRIVGVDAFAGALVVSLRKDGLAGLRIMPLGGGADFDLSFPEPIYTAELSTNSEFDTPTFRLSYRSLITPDSIYDCDFATGSLILRKQRPVLPGPDGRPYDPANYVQFREWAIADDGTRIPMSVVHRADVALDGDAPVYLYGYGSYEASIDPSFSIPRLSMLDRGVVYVIAHIRGGGEMGRRWYLDGKLFAKKNTFTDFIACARHLAAAGWTTPSRIVAHGRSAGGLLMGSIYNMGADAFGGVVAGVPFVDALNSMLDPTLPLTAIEWDEWGNPIADPEMYAYMKSYSPYENVTDQQYPPLFVYTSLNDTRVLYAEPIKWVSMIRATAPSASVLLKTEMEAGHAGRSGRYDAWREDTYFNAWILDRLGRA
jgi:oligopeptidase B